MCPDQDALVSYLYDEFDGSELLDRQEIEQHLDACESCAAEVAALGGVRRQMREWAAPEKTPLGFRVVREPAVTPRRWGGMSVPFPLAAAAALVLGATLGMARLDVQYDSHGFRVRTGWGHEDVATTAVASSTEISQTASAGSGSRAIEASGARVVSAASLGGAATGQGGVPPLVAPAPSSAAPWRSDMATLERQMRQEFAALRQSDLARAGGQVTAASVVNGDGASPRMSDQVLLQRIQQLIDQSEVRQQQNLALRVAEISRDFDVQRRSDLVRIEQSFGRINDQREQDATQQRLMLNAIRVSQQKPQ
jgi:hypothetical protein